MVGRPQLQPFTSSPDLTIGFLLACAGHANRMPNTQLPNQFDTPLRFIPHFKGELINPAFPRLSPSEKLHSKKRR